MIDGIIQAWYSRWRQRNRFYIIMHRSSSISINAYEVLSLKNMDIIETNPFLRFTYHFGRLFMALGYLGLIILLIKIEKLESLRFSWLGRQNGIN